MITPHPTATDLEALFALFPQESYLETFEEVPADRVPQPYHKLLVHQHHMTVTVEKHHGSLVDVKVIDEYESGDDYARKILLTRQSDGKVVQFGLVRIHLHFCSPAVRKEILAKQTPLGRILINNNVLRRIDPTHFLKITPGSAMMDWFGISEPKTTYGRLAIIYCDEQPAIELLEIVSPE